MRRIYSLLIAIICTLPVSAQGDTLQLRLTLDEVIGIAREQSPMATMARHQFRSSYWEYRAYQASFLPRLSLNSTLPDINRSIDKIVKDDGTEDFVSRSVMNTSVEMELSQNVGFTGGNIFLNSSLQRIDNLGENPDLSYLSYPFTSRPCNLQFFRIP